MLRRGRVIRCKVKAGKIKREELKVQFFQGRGAVDYKAMESREGWRLEPLNNAMDTRYSEVYQFD